MPEVHALLGASSSHRWLHCTAAPRLEENFPNTSSVYAEEGTFCHSCGEYKIRSYLGQKMSKPESEEYDTDEIENISDEYSQFVIERIEEFKQNGMNSSGPLALVEVRVDYSHLVPSGFGTADAVILGRDEDGTGVLHICDLKTGRGVFVDVNHNPQLMLYALGALHCFGYLQDVDVVRMSIIQPRLENINTFEMKRSDLEAWGESIKPIAKEAFEGGPAAHQVPGDWCRFCRAKSVCKACADEAMALTKDEFVDLDGDEVLAAAGAIDDASLSDGSVEDDSGTGSVGSGSATVPVFKQPGLLTNEQIERVLPTLNRIRDWIDSVFAYVSGEAINHGVHWNGYKVVEGRSRRQYTDPDAVAKAVLAAGYTEDQIYTRSLLTLSALEKKMGKKKFAEVCGEYVLKPPGKLTVVPDSDPRDAVNITDTGEIRYHPDAADEFSSVE